METLDKKDLQILRTLQVNARLTTKELAARVNLSSTPVFERLRRLENGGYIKKYIAVLDAEKLNLGFVVFCRVKLSKLNREIATEFTRIIQDIPEVTECYNILRLSVKDPCPKHEILPGVYPQCSGNNRQPRFTGKYFCDG